MARVSSALILLLVALLGGCAGKPVEVAAVPPAPTAAPPAPLPPLPPGASLNQLIPPIAADGRYLTPNHAIGPAETIWHMRSALNVAAIGCRDAGEAETVARYNALLSAHKKTLADADSAVRAVYRARHGSGWQAVHDTQMTRVYNFFSQVPVHERFCATAAGLLAEAMALPPAELQGFALTALPRLEEPFIDFYRAYDAYRTARQQAPASPQLPYEVVLR